MLGRLIKLFIKIVSKQASKQLRCSKVIGCMTVIKYQEIKNSGLYSYE